MSEPVAAERYAARWRTTWAATRLRCLVGFHDWSTWGVGRAVDLEWVSPAVASQGGWDTVFHDTSQGLARCHQAQERACLRCGKRQRHYFWASPEDRKLCLELGGGYFVLTYRTGVGVGLFTGPPPAGVDSARLDDVVLPPLRERPWPDPGPVPLGCRLGLYHIRRYRAQPRFQYERMCPFCNLIIWL